MFLQHMQVQFTVNGDRFECDEGIAEIIKVLNRNEFHTSMSCEEMNAPRQFHGKSYARHVWIEFYSAACLYFLMERAFGVAKRVPPYSEDMEFFETVPEDEQD